MAVLIIQFRLDLEKNGRHVSDASKRATDILHTFKTESAARAFAAGKPKKEINYERLAKRMYGAKSIREARGIYEKGVGK